MSLPTALLVHTVTRVRPVVGSDAYNDRTLDYDGGARTSVTGRLVARTTSDRRQASDDGRDADLQGWTWLTNDNDLTTDDRLEWAGHPSGTMVFEVDGPPLPKHDGTGFHHLRAELRVFRG